MLDHARMILLSSFVRYHWVERCLACGEAVQSVSLSPGQVEDGSMVLLLPQILGAEVISTHAGDAIAQRL
jgi:hypothetical protein